MKNLKINNKNLLFSLILSGTLVLNGCGLKKYSERDLNFSNGDTIDSEIELIADKTTLDEEQVFEGREFNLGDELQRYQTLYDGKYYWECNQIMEQVGAFLLQQQMAETLGIDCNDIVQFKIIPKTDADTSSTTYTVQIIYDHNGSLEVKEVLLRDGEARRMGINIVRASSGGFDSQEDLDALYKAYQEFIMTSGKMSDYELFSSEFDSEKIESYCKNR